MKLFFYSSAVIGLSLGLNACSSSNSNSNSSITSGSTTEVRATAVSGNQVGLNGSYQTGCHASSAPTDSTSEFLVISDITWTYTKNDFTGTTACIGSPATTTVVTATLSANAIDSAIVGWEDGDGASTTAPMASDNSGLLSDTEAFTPLSLLVTASTDPSISVGATVNDLYYVIDDTGTTLILYRDSDATHAGDFDPWLVVP